jgi:hypothetical protein
MRENKRKKLSNKPICPACGAVITVRCETWHNRLGRCLRHSNHTGPHYFAAKSIQDDPTFWEALQDPWSVVYFPEPEKIGRDEKGGEPEGDPEPRHAVEHPPPAGDGELEKRIEETSQRILIIEKALNGIAGSLENMVLLSARTIEKLDSVEVKLEGNFSTWAKVIDEIYCLVDSISKGIALVLTMLERKGGELEHGELEHGELEHGELEGDPDPRHAGEHPPPAGERKRLSACRHCGSSKVNVNRIRYSEEITGFKFRYFVICEECGMRGPKKSSSKAASEDWDLLPRIANSRLLDMLEKILSIIDKK